MIVVPRIVVCRHMWQVVRGLEKEFSEFECVCRSGYLSGARVLFSFSSSVSLPSGQLPDSLDLVAMVTAQCP